MATGNTSEPAIFTPEIREGMVQQVKRGFGLTAEEEDGLNTILAALDGYKLVDVNTALIDVMTKIIKGESLC